jgi:HAD superfamily hydrolase (TIGR01509 family)
LDASDGRDVIEALVFDFDGLILDTEGPVFQAWREAFEAHGCSLTMADWALEVGTSGAIDLVAVLQDRAGGRVDIDEMHTRRRSRRDELLAVETVRGGVTEWLDRAEVLGMAVAIASSSPDEWVSTHLDRLGLRGRFAAIVCCGDGIAGKPEPDTYLAATAAIGVDPAHALALEDSPHGITAAQRAGMRCVAVPNAITAQLDISHADLVLESLEIASLDEILARFEP